MTTMSSGPQATSKLAFNIKPGESYTIRRKVLKVLGAAFHIYDPQGGVVGYCKQKAFKLKEDIRIFTDESRSQEWLVIKARKMLDFGRTGRWWGRCDARGSSPRSCAIRGWCSTPRGSSSPT